MLQRGSEPRPVSSGHAARSPPKETDSTPTSPSGQHKPDGPRQYPSLPTQPVPEADAQPTPTSIDDKPALQASRSTGFQDILNPTEQGLTRAEVSPAQSRASFEEERQQPAQASNHPGEGGSPSRFYMAQPPPSTPRQGPGPSGHMGGPASTGPEDHPPTRQESPVAVHGYPATLGRHILTPRSPRVAALGRSATGPLDTQHHISLPPPGPRAMAARHDVSPLSGPPSFPGAHYPPGQAQGPGPHMSSATDSGSMRSLSQPMHGHGRSHSQSMESPPFTTARDQGVRPILFSPAPHHSSSLPPGGPPPTRMLAGDNRWSSMSSMGVPSTRTIAVAEGQHVLTITPTHGEEIMVPVDMHQASKQADEKRQRNAGASARFRQRKKEREKEQQAGIHRLESINRDLERRLRETEIERDFYRNERNRFRSLVAQTPGISEHAERAPPSPTRSTRSAGSFATDNSPLSGPPPGAHHPHPLGMGHSHAHSLGHGHPHGHPPPYDPSDRPTQRRRTETEPGFTPPAYGQVSRAMPSQAYGMSPSPHHSPHPTPGHGRLPPLRLEQSSPSPEYQLPSTSYPPSSLPPPPLPQSQQRHPTHYTSWGRPSHEAGWAPEQKGPLNRGNR